MGIVYADFIASQPQHDAPVIEEQSCILPFTWDGSSWIDPYHDGYEFQITAATGGPWTPERSFDGINWDPCYIYDGLANKVTAIQVSNVGKIYSVDGRVYFRLTPTTNMDTISGMMRSS